MTSEQRIDAIKELANGLTGEELYVLANELMPQHFATSGWLDVSLPNSSYTVVQSEMTVSDRKELTITTAASPFQATQSGTLK